MSEFSTVARDTLLRTLQDILGELADQIGVLPSECKDCPVMKTLSEFAVKLRKAGLQEEAEIVSSVRDFYNI
ncbi:MAG: hypothetical protein KGD60_08885 [Candidatus Thorarchaeota archaeon]|nr:hypothetical protein [Candidatus Thorarchaeota archaeon]